MSLITQQQPRFTSLRKREKKQISLPILLSIVFHSLIFLLIGGIVVFEAPIQRQLFTSDEPTVAVTEPENNTLLEEDAAMPEPESPVSLAEPTEQPMAAVEFHASTITTTAAPQYSVFAPSVSGIAIGRTLGGTGQRSSAGAAGSSGGTPYQYIFNQKIEASQFGVIVDISGSMSPFIPTVINEVLSKFPTANFFFMIGCGMEDLNPGAASKIEELNPSNYKTLLEGMGNRIEKVVQKKGSFTFTGRIGNVAKATYTPAAMDRLLEANVDTIYWFADFTDPARLRPIREVGHKLKRKGVTLYLHHPAGLPSNFSKIDYAPNEAKVATDNMELFNKAFFEQCKLKGGFIEEALFTGKISKKK